MQKINFFIGRGKKSLIKKPFILFELLLAFFLLSCIFFPMIKNHYCFMRSACERLEKIQLECIKENIFAKIHIQLLENQGFSFQDLSQGTNGVFPEKAIVCISKDHVKEFGIKYTISPIECCRRKSIHETYLLVEVKLSFFPKNTQSSYDYFSTFLLREHA